MPSCNFMFTSTSGFKSIVPTEETSRSPPSSRFLRKSCQRYGLPITSRANLVQVAKLNFFHPLSLLSYFTLMNVAPLTDISKYMTRDSFPTENTDKIPQPLIGLLVDSGVIPYIPETTNVSTSPLNIGILLLNHDSLTPISPPRSNFLCIVL